MPKEGWFQSCFLCSTITARTEKYNKEKNYYKIYLCPYCGRNLKIMHSMRFRFNIHLLEYINKEEKLFNERIHQKTDRQKLNQEIQERALE